MSIDTLQANKIASLAQLRIDEQQKEAFINKLNDILEWADQLSNVNTEGVAPLINVSEITLPLRPDIVNDGDIQEQILANAPEAVSGFFAVPKVVE